MTVSRRLIVLGLGVVLAYYAAERANAADAPPDYPNHAVRIIEGTARSMGVDVN